MPLSERERLRRSDTLSDRSDLSRREVTVSFDIFDTRRPEPGEGSGDVFGGSAANARRYYVTFSRYIIV